MPENNIPLTLQFPKKRERYFVIKVENLEGNGIPYDIYKGIRTSAKNLATRHPDWPKDVFPSNEVQWDSKNSEFFIKPNIAGGVICF